jgi:uncharacterized protein (TIGR00106 family)
LLEEGMKMLAFFSVSPGDKGEHLSEYVARSLELIEASGLDYKIGPMGTTVEGEPEEVFELIKACHMRMREVSSRVATSVKIDDHVGRTGRLSGKVASVEKKIGHQLKK